MKKDISFDYIWLCPMKEEFNAVFEAISSDGESFKSFDYYYMLDEKQLKHFCFNHNNQKIAVFQCGIGRIASVSTLTKILEKYTTNSIIVLGVAGACSPDLKIGDTVFAERILIKDFDIQEKYQETGLSERDILNSDVKETSINLSNPMSRYLSSRLKPADFYTVDHFVYDKKELHVDGLSTIVDMETGNLFTIAKQYGIRSFLAFRTISDIYSEDGKQTTMEEFEENLRIATGRLGDVVEFIINSENKIRRNTFFTYLDFVQDFPKEGINFLDIQSILARPLIFNAIIDKMLFLIQKYSFNPSKIIGLDSRGFIFASILAEKLGVPLVLARKKGKLPKECFSATYDLEYGTATIEIEKGLIQSTDRVLVVDDVLATGGTLQAVFDILRHQCGRPMYHGLVFADLQLPEGKLVDPYIPCESVIQLEQFD